MSFRGELNRVTEKMPYWIISRLIIVDPCETYPLWVSSVMLMFEFISRIAFVYVKLYLILYIAVAEAFLRNLYNERAL